MSARPTWLVTGAHGFLGANVGALLEGRVHRIGAARRMAEPDALFDHYIACDLEDPAALVDAIEAHRPAVVVHAAALASHRACNDDPRLARLVNAQASEALARAAERAGSRFVLVSTDAVFDGARGHYSETDAPCPASIYGETKLEAEQRVLAAVPALVLRTNFFGWSPSGRRSILEFFVNALSGGEQVRGFTDFTTSSAYVRTLAEAIWDLCAADAVGVVHLTSPDSMTKYEFGVCVADEFGLDAGLITAATSDLQPPRPRDISLDVSRAQELLGRSLPSMRAGIVEAHRDRTALRRRLADEPEP